jgi:hypothetical protein
VRFTIASFSIATDGAESVLQRTSVSAINPAGTRKEAQQLFDAWKKRDASGVRLINAHGETVYNHDSGQCRGCDRPAAKGAVRARRPRSSN